MATLNSIGHNLEIEGQIGAKLTLQGYHFIFYEIDGAVFVRLGYDHN